MDKQPNQSPRLPAWQAGRPKHPISKREAFRRINEIAIEQANRLDVDEPKMIDPHKPRLARLPGGQVPKNSR